MALLYKRRKESIFQQNPLSIAFVRSYKNVEFGLDSGRGLLILNYRGLGNHAADGGGNIGGSEKNNGQGWMRLVLRYEDYELASAFLKCFYLIQKQMK